jgi:hypothetical protein
LFPDLRYSAALGSRDVFNSIVIGGVLAENGMVSFKKALSVDDVEAVRAYMVERAHYAVKNGPGGFAAFADDPRTSKEPAPPKPSTDAPH